MDTPTDGRRATWYIGLAAVLANVVVVFGGTALAWALGLRPPSNAIDERDFEETIAPRATEPLALEPEASEPVARDPAAADLSSAGAEVRRQP